MNAENSTLDTIDLSMVEKLYDDIVWTHKIHEKQADIYAQAGKKLQIVSIICIAISGIFAGVSISVDCTILSTAATIFAAVALFVSIYREAKPYEVYVCEHSSYAKEYLALREELTAFLSGHPKKEGTIDCVRCKYIQLCNHAPRTTDQAVSEAEIAIKNHEGKLYRDLFDTNSIGSEE